MPKDQQIATEASRQLEEAYSMLTCARITLANCEGYGKQGTQTAEVFNVLLRVERELVAVQNRLERIGKPPIEMVAS